MKKGIEAIVSVINGLTSIQTIKKGLTTVYESFKELLISGIPPLTLLNVYHNKSNEKYNKLIDYKIYGESVQDGTPTSDTPIEIESVGEKTVNLLQLYDNLDQTINGVKIKVNSDKSISVNGTCTANITITIADFDLKQGINYHYSGCPAGGSGSTYRLYFGYGGVDTGNGDSITPSRDISNSPIKLMLYSGQVYENLTFYPMINAKTKSKVYEPYGYKIPVKVGGKNIYNPTVNTQTLNGITATRNSDNTYTVNGTATATTYIHLGTIPVNVGTTYYLSGGTTEARLDFQLREGSTGLGTLINSGGISVHSPEKAYSTTDNINVVIAVSSGATVNNIVVKPMICLNETDNYEPYVEPITTNIYLNEPLRKIGDYSDYIDFENGKVVRNVFCRNFTGGESIGIPGTAITGYTPFRYIDTNPITYPFVCNYLPFWDIQYGNASGKECLTRISSNGKQMFFTISNDRIPLNDTTAFKNWLKELNSSGNPMTVYSCLTTPNDTETIELPNIPTYVGRNIIEIDTSISPSNMEVKYYGK